MGCQLRCQIANNHKKFNVTLTAVSYYNEVRKLYYSWNLSKGITGIVVLLASLSQVINFIGTRRDAINFDASQSSQL